MLLYFYLLTLSQVKYIFGSETFPAAKYVLGSETCFQHVLVRLAVFFKTPKAGSSLPEYGKPVVTIFKPVSSFNILLNSRNILFNSRNFYSIQELFYSIQELFIQFKHFLFNSRTFYSIQELFIQFKKFLFNSRTFLFNSRTFSSIQEILVLRAFLSWHRLKFSFFPAILSPNPFQNQYGRQSSQSFRTLKPSFLDYFESPSGRAWYKYSNTVSWRKYDDNNTVLW